MPVYIKITDIKGDVTPAGSGNGGVWKTTNFLAADTAARSGPGGGPKVNLYSGSDGAGLMQISRISLTPGIGGVEGRDFAAARKLDHLIAAARSQGPTGKLYVAAEAGVYQNGAAFGGQGRLLTGSDQGVWRSINGSNNLKQLGLGVHNTHSVEIIVTDNGGKVIGSHRLPRVSVTGTSGTFTLTFNGQTTGGF